LKPGKDVDNDINPKLGRALKDYTGPTLAVTSMKRHGSGHSQHDHGLALDIELDGKVLSYLQSKEGQQWLKKHHMNYLVEFPNYTKTYERFKKRYRKVVVNEQATGNHVHISVSRKHS